MDLETGRARQVGAGDNALPFGLGLFLVAIGDGIAPGAGVDLDHRRTQPRRHLDLLFIGRDEERHPDAGIVQLADEGGQRIVLTDHIQPTLGGQFLTPFRHQADRMWLGQKRKAEHVRGRSHLEIQGFGDFGLQPRHILVADVAAVLAQMRGDAVGAGLDCDLGGAHWIGPCATAGVTKGGDVVHIDAKAQRGSRHIFDP